MRATLAYPHPLSTPKPTRPPADIRQPVTRRGREVYEHSSQMRRALRIWLGAGWHSYAAPGAAGHYLTNDDESQLLLVKRDGRVEQLV